MNNKKVETWKCIKCDNTYTEYPMDKHSSNLGEYLRYSGICGEKCLNKYSKDEQHRLSVKFLLEGEGLKLKYNGVNVV
tara:strand:+ start:338 stop:571 length:234 start_codon:yes stop_codon:yes gene_type:complete